MLHKLSPHSPEPVDCADRLLSNGGTSYTVHANGNTTARSSDTLSYDRLNRLTSAMVGGSTTTYAYDGDGKRVSSTTGGVTTRYVYDVSGGLPVLLDDGARRYVWGARGLAYTVDKTSGAATWSHADGLGSVRALTDSTGVVIQTYGTDAWGVPTGAQTLGSSAQPMQFTGEVRDSTGLVYLRARMYDPSSGRFLQRDPLAGRPGTPSTLNRFAYGWNSPARLTDPSGLSPLDLCKPGDTKCQAMYDVMEVAMFEDVGGALATGMAAGDTMTSLMLRGKSLSEAADIMQGRTACGPNSFDGDTPVLTEDGARPIRSLRVGERVWAWSEHTQSAGWFAVTAVIQHSDPEEWALTIAGQTLTTTAEHPFYVQGRGWVPAALLRVGDQVRGVDGRSGTVQAVAVRHGEREMFNLSVEGAHTFFVGEGAWLVHNANCPISVGVNWERGDSRNWSQRVTDLVNAVGDALGCHTCGTMSSGTLTGNWVRDHQLPNAIRPAGDRVFIYPQCQKCNNLQGQAVREYQRLRASGASPEALAGILQRITGGTLTR